MWRIKHQGHVELSGTRDRKRRRKLAFDDFSLVSAHPILPLDALVPPAAESPVNSANES
jgi:hypothetical protein